MTHTRHQIYILFVSKMNSSLFPNKVITRLDVTNMFQGAASIVVYSKLALFVRFLVVFDFVSLCLEWSGGHPLGKRSPLGVPFFFFYFFLSCLVS